MISLEDLARIAEIKFSDIVDSAEMMDAKLRIMLADGTLWMCGCLRNWQAALVSIGSIRLPVSSTVTIIFLTQIGGIFPLFRIIPITALKTM